MLEDAVSFTFFSIRVYAYGLFAAIGAAAALLTFFLFSRQAKMPPGITRLWGVFAFVAGLVLSRTFYCLADSGFASVASFEAVFLLSGGGYSMMGALMGACLAALMSAKILKIKGTQIMDLVLPSLMIFVTIARLGEGFTELGLSRPLVDDMFNNTFLVKYDTDFYLRTYLLESVSALVIFFVLLDKNRKAHQAGVTAIKGILYFGLSQILMESLRFDMHMRFEFISVQQVFCMLLVFVITITTAVRLLKLGVKKALPLGAVIGLFLLAGLLVGLEFMIDRSGTSRYLLYAIYALALLGQGAITSILINRSFIWNGEK